ncbi:hypothetical protein UA08_05212 [Talaromyces atroroseus]|uniref:Zn(2)-C6 fungal-type domain-containing protein n=1 Tax=Talaromyces atroroseus TaxID=1441469 RepID=A0A225AVI2_TALAT|nr:hypothetical protein UA08_05212 [Talaromyces atroroseus]OKL59609.1 hypothetical protein UA08_05212 [Talaromyces atroroseus]
MSALLRNTQGCWTCRVRRKKCDGARPSCSTCQSLSITCYGYGLKPDWIDRGEKEKAMIDSFKQVVKRTSRKKAVAKPSQASAQLSTIAPKGSTGSSSSPRSHGYEPDHGSSMDERMKTLQGGLLFEQPRKDHHDNLVLFPISAQESASLMHYLDNVFPLQYPMYRASVLEGGRGWLLAPMFRIKPLYHATLAISSYHRRKIFFTGQGSEWKIHLRAATNMQERYFRDNLVDYGLSKGAGAILRGNRNFSVDDGPTVMEEIVIYKFFTGVIIWLDIVSSITAGEAPHLLPYHFRDISSTSPWVRLEEIMGCQNQVMLQIGRIAALYEHKTQSLQKGYLVNTSIEETVRDISREIESCLTQTALRGLGFSIGTNTSPVPKSLITSNSTTLVTHMFALMACIYLHLVIYGFQNLELLEPTTYKAMETLRTRFPAHLLPAIVCPLYVIGSVATQEEDRLFFRQVFASPPLLDPLFEHRTKVLTALEEAWRKREARNDFTWGDSLEMVDDLLLL